jgi:hypothetical protein
MSALKQVIIELTPQQRSEIKRELNKEGFAKKVRES